MSVNMLEVLETGITIVCAISIIIGIIRFIWAFFSSSSMWLDDVKIQVESFVADTDYEEYFTRDNTAIYPEVYRNYEDHEGEEITVNFFIPNNTVIRDLRIKKVEYKSIVTGRERYKTVKRIKQITPEQPLCVRVTIPIRTTP